MPDDKVLTPKQVHGMRNYFTMFSDFQELADSHEALRAKLAEAIGREQALRQFLAYQLKYRDCETLGFEENCACQYCKAVAYLGGEEAVRKIRSSTPEATP